MSFPSPSQRPTAPIWLPGPGLAPSTLFERRLLLRYDMVLPNSSMHVATLCLGPMGSLWAYIEGMDVLSLPFTATDSSNLAARARFGTSTLFERRLLLQYDMVLPNSSMHVATLCLGPMGSLWAYIEGMDVLSLPFTATNSSNLAARARFGTSTLFERRLLFQYDLVLPNSS